MDSTNRYAKQLTEQQRIIDPITPNPSARSLKVWKILYEHKSELDQWDIVCFAIEYMGGLLTAYPFLAKPVKHLGQLVYNAHYYHTVELGLCPLEAVSSVLAQESIGQALKDSGVSAKVAEESHTQEP